VFASGDEFLDHDAVFGVRPSLIIDFTEWPPGVAPGGKLLDEPYFVAEFGISLGQV
jgi:hydroxyquinol 1,2-dioxygenase